MSSWPFTDWPLIDWPYSLWLALLLAYLIGSLSGSLVLGRLLGGRFQGVDIRTQGSGNAGATNALRTRGWRFALAVLVIDVGKGMLVAGVFPALIVASQQTAFFWSGASLGAAFVLAAALGHCYPIWHGFRGGKGAGTLFGGHLLLAPTSAGIALLVWLLCLTRTGFVGLSTVLAGIALALAALWLVPDQGYQWLCMAAALLLLFTHRGNLQRLRAGTESRFAKAKLW